MNKPKRKNTKKPVIDKSKIVSPNCKGQYFCMPCIMPVKSRLITPVRSHGGVNPTKDYGFIIKSISSLRVWAYYGIGIDVLRGCFGDIPSKSVKFTFMFLQLVSVYPCHSLGYYSSIARVHHYGAVNAIGVLVGLGYVTRRKMPRRLGGAIVGYVVGDVYDITSSGIDFMKDIYARCGLLH